MRSVSVVVPHFFPEREENLLTIVDAVCGGSVKPLEIIIWCNSPLRGSVLRHVEVVRLVESTRNVGCQARFLAAMTALGDYVLFQDNDVCVRSKTVENLLTWAEQRAGVCSLDGYRIPKQGYALRQRVRGKGVITFEEVDVTLGRVEMVSRRLLLTMLRDFPFGEQTVMDDIAFSASCRKNGVPCEVVAALSPETYFDDLPTHGTGISYKLPAGYLSQRDRTFKQYFHGVMP
jgi:hypothetical protein